MQPQPVLPGQRLQALHAGEFGERVRSAGGVPGAGQADGDGVAGDLLLELLGGALGDDAAVVDDADPVAQRVGLVQVVGGEQHRHALLAQPADLGPDLGPAARVEPDGGLVQEQHPGPVDHAESEVEAAPLAARVGLAGAVAELAEVEGRQALLRALLRLGLADAVHPGLQDEFLARGGLVGGAAALGDVADPAADLAGLGTQVGAGHGGGPAVGGEEGGEHAQRGGLACAVRAEEAVDLALRDVEVDAAHRVDGVGAAAGPEGLAQPLGHDQPGLLCSVGGFG